MRALVLAAALLGGAAATAQADTTQPGTYSGRYALDAGPVLSGDRIVWAAQAPGTSDTYPTFLYSAPLAGGDAVQIRQIAEWTDDQEYSEGVDVGSLAAANGRIAWLTYGWSVQGGKFGSGSFNWAISTLDGLVCGPGEHGTMALSGDVLAVSGCGGVTVRDLGRPEIAPETLAPAGGPVHAAGPYVAWWTADGFEVLNRVTGARTTLDARLLSGPRRVSDLSPEGVLAVTVGDVHNRQLVWASPADPSWHTVSLPNLQLSAQIRVRGGRVASLSENDELWLADLAGGTRTLLADRDHSAAPEVVPFDFDGTYVTWGEDTCDSLTVTARPVSAGKFTLPRRTHCAVVVASTARGGRIRLRCPAPSDPDQTDRCRGTMTVRGLRRVKFNLAPRAWGTARVKTKRRGTVQVTVRSRTRGHTSVTRARVVLR
jgi:hypothetical protein